MGGDDTGSAGSGRSSQLVVVAVADPARRHDVVAALRAEIGATVLECGDADALFAWLRGVAPDVVYLDLGDDGVDCLDLCARVKALPHFRGAAVVVACRSRRPSAVVDAGCDAVLTDPADLHELVALVRRWVAGAAAGRL